MNILECILCPLFHLKDLATPVDLETPEKCPCKTTDVIFSGVWKHAKSSECCTCINHRRAQVFSKSFLVFSFYPFLSLSLDLSFMILMKIYCHDCEVSKYCKSIDGLTYNIFLCRLCNPKDSIPISPSTSQSAGYIK